MGEHIDRLHNNSLRTHSSESTRLARILAELQYLSPVVGSRTVIQRLLEYGAKTSGADRASILLADAASSSLQFAGGIGVSLDTRPSRQRSEGPADIVIQRGHPLAICNDHLGRSGLPQHLLHGTSHCSVILPLRSENRIVGVLNLARTDPHSHFEPQEIYRAAIMAAAAGPNVEAAVILGRLATEVADLRIASEEATHRLLNDLTDVMGILQLQSLLEGPEAGVEEALDAVQAMITTNSILRTDVRSGTDFGEIAITIVANFRRERGLHLRRIDLEVNAGSVRLDSKQSRALMMILLELLTNSVKHAFAPEQAGTIRVDLKAEAGEAVLSVTDNGRGIEKKMAHSGRESLGLRIVNSLARRDLAGEVVVEDADPGCRVMVVFPYLPVL